MIYSYTLIRVHPANDKDVYSKVRNFKEVKEVILTYGEYDLIIKVESDSMEDLDNFIFNRLRRIDGVAVTTTLLKA
jgi:anthranilate phosphoribosyltransferase